jgi:ubiquinone biosynthesis protein COQ9
VDSSCRQPEKKPMIDTSLPLGRAVAATLRLAGKRPWSEITLLDIADEAGLTLVELSRHVSSKPAALQAFARLVDDEVLRKAERREPDESLRERLFDVVMTRFETMAPYRPGLKRIAADPWLAPMLIGPVLRSQSWMLTAAGIPTEGLTGAARVAGLTSVYAATFQDWLTDDDAGLARTMAALDRRLRRGEGWIKSVDSMTSTVEGLTARARDMLGQVMNRRKGANPASASATQAPYPVAPAAQTDPSDDHAPRPPASPSSLH